MTCLILHVKSAWEKLKDAGSDFNPDPTLVDPGVREK